jgi:hypothetical protein
MSRIIQPHEYDAGAQSDSELARGARLGRTKRHKNDQFNTQFMACRSLHHGEGFFCDVQLFTPDSVARQHQWLPEDYGRFPATHVSAKCQPDLVQPGEIRLVISTGFVEHAALAIESRLPCRQEWVRQFRSGYDIVAESLEFDGLVIWPTCARIHLWTPTRPAPRGQNRRHLIFNHQNVYMYNSVEPAVRMYYYPDQLPPHSQIERCACGTWLVWLHKEVDSHPL